MYHSAMEPRPVSCSSFVPLLRRMSYLILKRGFDLVFSLVLLVTCALLMAVIALVVWLDSPGKIIYTQIRLGYGGKPFTIYKFRSMQQSTAPDDAKWTSENDTRITRVGHILRLTHLDELPQLLNILMGQMSFVGTRPEVPRYVRQYTPQMLATLLLPAGVTSQASIRYKDEDRLLDSSADPDRTYVEQVLPGKMEYNLNSLLDFSLWQDFKTMVQTVGAVLH